MESIIYAIVSAAAKPMIDRIIELFAGRSDADADAEANRVIQKTYGVLKGNLTGGCISLLKLLEDNSGGSLYPDQIRERLYPELDIPKKYMRTFDREFRYRLEFMALNGLVKRESGVEYGISRLGLAFLTEARRRKDYLTEISGS